MRKRKRAKSAIQKILAGMLVLVMMMTIVPAEAAYAAEYTDVDDAVVTTTEELFKIQYEPAGRWYAEAGYPNLFFDGTDHYSDTGSNEDYYEMKFIGTGIEIYGSKNTAHANADVYIDGEKVGEVLSGQESGATVHKQKLFETQGLENAEHVLKVVRKSGQTKALQVDKVRVYHGELAATKIILNAESVKLGVGGSKRVELASVEPWVIKNPEIEWKSADESIATVDENGLITATTTADERKETVITATVKGTDVSANVKVVVDPLAEAMSVSIGDEKLLETQQDYEKLISAEEKDSWSAVAWKGDQLNSKINILAKEADIHNVTVTAGDFKNKAGNILPAENFEIKWLKEILANDGRNMAGQVNAYPDVIHKGGATDVKAETVKFAWISIEIPEDTKPGVYTGEITVTANELKKPLTFTYTIEVIDLVQPAPEATEIQIWQHPFSVANYYLGLGAVPTGGISYEVNEEFYFTEQHFNLMRASMEEYVSLGGHDLVANIVEEAWNHQSYYNDLSMVKWTKKTDGTWEFDYTWYDAWVEFGIECGVINPETELGQIKCYSIVPWNNQVAYYSEASGRVVEESQTPGSASWKALWEPFLKDFMEHSKEKGWFDITYISMDERSLDQLRPTVELIESVKDGEGKCFKISSALNYAAPQYYDFTDRIHDISINLGNCSNQAQMNALSDHRRELGLKTTYYTCTGNYPGNFIISDPGDNYWQIWYSMTLGTDGFMRWAWDNYVYDMHGNASYRYWEPGDGWYIYPEERESVGADYEAVFYSTPRYELFKQGVRDVAKAKYLMAQSDVLAQEIDTLVAGLKHPGQSFYHGSAVAVNEAERMLLHSETDRIYDAVTALAKAFVEETKPPVVEEDEVVRLYGSGRYETGYAVANELKEVLGVEKFEAVVVATGKNFADALAGSYLAVEKNAPILLTNGKDDNIAELHAYIKANVTEGGTVYILGGEGAVPTAVDAIKGYDVVRLFGDSRYDTNLEILKEAGVTGDSIIVATGKTFADSLSASAAKLPILLVKQNAVLNDAQENILEGMNSIYIVGGEGAVSTAYEAELKAFGEVTRVFGDSRYDTSVKVARTFCKDVEKAVVASGKNFPDGLCGGPLAAAMNAPLVLTKDGGADAAASYVAENGITSGFVLGGDGALADDTVVNVFALESAEDIKVDNTEKDDFVGFFWFTLADTYLSSMKTNLDAELAKVGLEAEKNFVHYDANRNQDTQMEQIHAAIKDGATCLVVNVVQAGSKEVSQQIIDKASAAGIPVVFFNRIIELEGDGESVLESYDKCAFVGANAPEAGYVQGQMIGEYLVENYNAVDLNGDGKISYAMFMGQLKNPDAVYRTRYSVESANAVLEKAGKPELVYFDSSNEDGYQVDQEEPWSPDAVNRLMNTNLVKYNEDNGNMIELIICNNDGMAEGAISALVSFGYNTEDSTVIPVFGIDGTARAKELIEQGTMSGTIEHDTEGVATCLADLVDNAKSGKNLMDGTEGYNFAEGFTNKIFIPYVPYTEK